MLNLAEKFTPEAVEATEDDGLVAIEYVVMAGILIAGLAGLAWAGAFGALTTKLSTLIDTITERRPRTVRGGLRPPPSHYLRSP